MSPHIYMGVKPKMKTLIEKIKELIDSWDLKTVEKMQLEEQLFNLNKEFIKDLKEGLAEQSEFKLNEKIIDKLAGDFK